MLSIPFFIGRRLLCTLEDDYRGNVLRKGNSFCIIQGSAIHFSLAAMFALFLCSLFNVLVAVVTFSTDSVLKRHPKATLIIELFVAITISGLLVGFAHTGCSYNAEPFFMYCCLPTGYDNIFYTITLPLQIIIISCLIMMLLIIRRLRQSSALRSSLNIGEDSTSAAQLAVSYRFMILVIFMPFSFLLMFLILGSYQTFHDKQMITDIGHLIECKQQFLSKLSKSQVSESCTSTATVRGLFAVLIAQPIYFATFSVLLVVYSTIPAPARALWAKHMSQVKKLFWCIDNVK
jgi:hypothetical protein